MIMTADVINRPLFKVLRTLNVPEDAALDAAGGFVTNDQLNTLATKDDVRHDIDLVRKDLDLLRKDLTTRMVVIVGGGVLVLTQLVPPGKVYELVIALAHHLGA